MTRKKHNAPPKDPDWDLTNEPWPFEREDHEIEYRYEEWRDK